jgi:hypothetical protein
MPLLVERETGYDRDLEFFGIRNIPDGKNCFNNLMLLCLGSFGREEATNHFARQWEQTLITQVSQLSSH